MILYYFMESEHKNEYYEVPKTKSNRVGLEPTDNASKEAIQSLYRFNVECEDETNMVAYDAKELSRRMIEKFKASKCYKAKSEAERQEIIQYLKDNPDENIPGINM